MVTDHILQNVYTVNTLKNSELFQRHSGNSMYRVLWAKSDNQFIARTVDHLQTTLTQQ